MSQVFGDIHERHAAMTELALEPVVAAERRLELFTECVAQRDTEKRAWNADDGGCGVIEWRANIPSPVADGHPGPPSAVATVARDFFLPSGATTRFAPSLIDAHSAGAGDPAFLMEEVR
jgi:hypothetical protein